MTTASKKAQTILAGTDGLAKLLRQYGCGPVAFAGTDESLYERRLVFDHVVDLLPVFESRELTDST